MRYKVAIMLFKSASDGETIGGETMSLRRKKTVACPKCNKESDYLFWESLNGDLDPEAKKKDVLTPKKRKPRKSKADQIKLLVKQAQKSGMKLDEIADKLGMALPE